MNQSLYRIVFNKARGLLMVVAENTPSQSKTTTSGSGGTGTRFIARIGVLRLALLVLVGSAEIVMPVQAAVVADRNAASNQQATILKTTNGVELVNIQTPSAGGVSRNTYSQFDVERGGVILNNSRTDAQTQQGGWVQGNPWLATGSARIILNEVRSANPSSLRGFVEVAGQRAEVIIANPSGIQCDGCGFINASRATLTTGTALFNGDALTGFRVGQGVITVSGAGLDASQTDYTSLIARAVEINAGVWANNLNVAAGVGDVAQSGDSMLSGSQSTSTDGGAPKFAIDVAALGGMYAGQIHLLGTEAGVGVRNAGQIGASVGEVRVLANGAIENTGLITANTQLKLQSQQGFSNAGELRGNEALNIKTTGALNNSGFITAGKDITLQAQGPQGTLNNATTGYIVAGLQSDSTLGTQGALNAQADAAITAAGLLASGGEQQWAAPQLSLAGSQVIASQLALDGERVNLQGAVAGVSNTLNIHATQSLSTSGAQISANQLNLQTPVLDNRGGQLRQLGAADLTLNVESQIDNRGGVLGANANNFTVTTAHLKNDAGSVLHAGTGSLTIQTAEQQGNQATIVSAGTLNLASQALSYTQSQIEAKAVKLDSNNATLDGSQLNTSGALQLSVNQIFSARNAKLSAGQITVNATNFYTQGGQWQQSGLGETRFDIAEQFDATGARIASNTAQLNLNAKQFIANHAQIEQTSTGVLNIQAQNQSADQALIRSAGALNFSGQTLNYTQSDIQAKSIGITATAATLDASQLTSNTALQANITQTLSTKGATLNAQNITVTANKLENQGGQWQQSGNGDTQFNITTQLDNSGGQIASNGNHVTLNAAELINDRGSIAHAGSGSLNVNVSNQHGDQGQIASSGALQLTGQTLNYTNGAIQAKQIALIGDTATLDGNQVTSAGTLQADIAQALSTRHATLSAEQISLNSNSLDNTSGKLLQSGQGDMALNITSVLNNSDGQIAANANNLTVHAAELNNDRGTIEHAGTGTLTVDVANQHGAQAKVASAGALSFSAQTLNYTQSNIQAQSIGITATAATLDASLLTSNTALQANIAQTLSTKNATLKAQNVTVTANKLENQGGQWQQSGNGDTQFNITTQLDNSGGQIASNGNHVTLNAAELVNDRGSIAHAGSGSLNVNVSNQHGDQGQIASTGALQLTGQTLNYTNGTIQANLIALTGNTATLDGSQVTSTGALQANIVQVLSTRHATLSAEQLSLSSNSLDNTSGKLLQSGQADMALNITSVLNNSDGQIAANANNLTVHAAELNNDRGTIEHAGTGTLTLDVANQHGAQAKIASAGALNLNGQTLNYTQSDVQAKQITLNSNNATFDSSLLASEGALLANIGQTLSTQNATIAANQMTVTAAALNNQGGEWLQSGQADLSIQVTGQLNNTAGRIAANANNLTLNAGELVNDRASIEHAGNGTLKLDVANQHGESSQLVSTGILVLNSQSVRYTNSDLQANAIRIQGGSANVDGSVLTSDRSLDIQLNQALSSQNASVAADQINLNAASLDNRNGEWIQSGTGDMNFTVVGLLDNGSGRLASNATNVTLKAAQLANAGGQLEHAGQGLLTIQANQLDNSQGELLTLGNAQINSASVLNNSGVLQANQLALAGNTLSNQQGQIILTGSSTNQIALTGAFDNAAGVVASTADLGVNASAINNRGGQLLIVSPVAAQNTLSISTTGNLDNSADGLIQGSRLNLNNASLNNSGGQIVANDVLEVQTGSLNNNSGVLAAQNNARIQSANLDNRNGTLGSVNGSLQLTSAAIDNRNGKLIAGQTLNLASSTLDNRAGNISGQQLVLNTNGQNLLNANGTIYASRDLTLNSGAIDNAAGFIRADGNALLNTHGQALSNTDSAGSKGIQSGGDLTIQAGNVDNRAGLLLSSGKMDIDGATFNNGGQVYSAQTLQIDATAINNLGGQIQSSGNLTLNANTVNNQSSLIRSGSAVTINSANLDNRNTGSNTGIEGNNIALTVNQFDNRSGSVRAGQNLAVNSSGSFYNGSGMFAAGQSLNVADNSSSKTLVLDNSGGEMQSGGTLNLNLASYNGAGRLASLGNLSVSLLGNYTYSGMIESNQNLSFSITGQFTNAGLMRAAQTLEIRAGGIDNQASGELSAGTVHLATAGLITNRGLIDGGLTWIEAGTLNNLGTGRIYGDYISIAATNLNNTLENGTAATIAARQQLDLGVTNLNNSEHGFIFSGGDMAIGGYLDAYLNAAGQTTLISNRSATIEATGNLSIAANRIENRDIHLVIGDGQAYTVTEDYYVPDGSQQRYDAPNASMVQANTSGYHHQYLATVDGNFTTWDHTTSSQIIRETKVISSDAAKIVSGGNMTLSGGSLLNENSQVLAGRTLSTASLGNVQNVQTMGTRTIDFTETTTSYWNERSLSWENACTYHPDCGPYDGKRNSTVTTSSTSNTPITLGSGSYGGNMTVVDSDPSIGNRQQHATNVVNAATGSVQAQAGTNASLQATNLSTAQANPDSAAVQESMAQQALTTAQIGQMQNAEVQEQNTNNQQAPNSVGSASASIVQAVVGMSKAQLSEMEQQPTSILQAIKGLQRQNVSQIRSVNTTFNLPNNSLFRINPKSNLRYLVETDPRFANYKNWLSSDYILDRLHYDPDLTQKRLGDGFYEQKLVREQIAQLTGQRFLGDYSDDDEQYRALMDNGVAFAEQYNLRPGVALSAEQMAMLTSDLVWLVEQEVTLPDGSTTKVLSPQVYAVVRDGDIDGSGSLIAGRDLNIKLDGLLQNNGKIAGKDTLSLVANDIEMTGGRIHADSVSLAANQDLKQLGGLIDGLSEVQLSAKRDIVIASNSRTSSTTVTENNRQTNYGTTVTTATADTLGERAGVSVVGNGGTLVIHAGRDLTLTAADISNSGENGKTALSAERDITLATVDDVSRSSKVWQQANNSLTQDSKVLQGTRINAVGDLSMNAGNDLSATAATIRSDLGNISLAAGNNLTLTAGLNQESSVEIHQKLDKGMFSKKLTSTLDDVQRQDAVGTTVSAENVSIKSGNDLNVIGSDVAATKDVTLKAGNDLNVVSMIENYDERHLIETKKTGLFSTGGFSLTYGQQKQTNDTLIDGTKQSQSGSSIGSMEGNITLSAGNGARISGSTVSAVAGDINVLADHIQIDTGLDQEHRTDTQKFEQKGITVAVSAPVLSALQSLATSVEMAKTAGEAKDSRVSLIAGATAGVAAKNAFDGLSSMGGAQGATSNVSVSITYGESKSESKTTTDTSRNTGSTLSAGNNIKLIASGSGKDSDINIIGSDLDAKKNLTLAADGDVTLQAAQDGDTMKSKNSSSSWGVGVAITFGNGTASYGITANGSISRGHADGSGGQWQNSHASAGETLTIVSGGDTNLRGASATGNQILADIGGNLNIESLQDTSKYDSKQMSASASVTAGAGFSASASFSNEKMHADYAAVNEQSGLGAGDGGFNITVKGNTDLKGGVISSSADESLNNLTTGTLTVSNVENHADYKASSIGLSGGVDINGGAFGDKKDTKGNVKNGGSLGVPVVMAANGSDSTTTLSAISAGNITITDEAKQKELTGKTAAEMLAELNRDTGNTAGHLDNNFDKAEIQEAFKVTQAFVQETSTFMANRAAEADAKKKTRDQLAMGSPEWNAANADYQAAAKWEPGGEYGRAMTVLQVAAGGNVTGGLSNLVQNAAVGYLQSLGAEKVKQIADSLDDEGVRTALHAIVGCAGAAAAGQSCGAGALGAASSVVLNNVLDKLQKIDATKLSAAEKEERKNLIGSLIGGIATIAGGDAATANGAAQIEMENNTLKHEDLLRRRIDEVQKKNKSLAKINDEDLVKAAKNVFGRDEMRTFSSLKEAQQKTAEKGTIYYRDAAGNYRERYDVPPAYEEYARAIVNNAKYETNGKYDSLTKDNFGQLTRTLVDQVGTDAVSNNFGGSPELGLAIGIGSVGSVLKKNSRNVVDEGLEVPLARNIQEKKIYHDSKVAEVRADLESQGYQVSKKEISFRNTDSNGLTRPDVFAVNSMDGSIKLVEVKTGSASLSIRQSEIYPQIANGDAIPTGKVAKSLGLIPGKPLKDQGYPNGIPIEVRNFK